MRSLVLSALALGLGACASLPSATPQRSGAEIDAFAAQAMAGAGAKGLAIAAVDAGRVVHVGAYGDRNARGDPLTADTVMYGASLTKAAFGYVVMQLVEEGKLDLDASIATYLPQPLPSYGDAQITRAYARWSDLAGDERWRKLTPRILLNHASGFSNFGFLEPDGKLRFHFDPGARYAYSGDGMMLLQFVIEKGLGLDLQAEMQRRIFGPLGMTNTSLIWRPDFAANLADGWDTNGAVKPHDERSRVRGAGSMDSTITDMGRLAAGYVSGVGLSPAGRSELTRPHLTITTRTQFPSLQQEAPVAERIPGLAAGLGVIVFEGPQGRGFYKGGHNDTTGNTWVCIERGKRCVVILANDVRAEAAFPAIVRFVLGETGAPWGWEYGEKEMWEADS